eukprot:EST44080.1 hypothetical protein SS50377_jh010 [Spironucleus salmonicida]
MLSSINYNIIINQPSKVFYIYGQLIGDFNKQTLLRQLSFMIEQNAHQEVNSFIPKLKQLDQLIQVYKLTEIILMPTLYNIYNISNFAKFFSVIQLKLQQNELLQFVDYGQLFPNIPVSITETSIIKSYQNFFQYQARKKLKITQNIKISSQISGNIIKITPKNKQVIILATKILYILLETYLQQLINIEQSTSMTGINVTYQQIILQFQKSQFNLSQIFTLLKQQEFLQIFDVLQQYRYSIQMGLFSALPQLNSQIDESLKLIDDLFDCKQTLFIALDNHEIQLTKTIQLYQQLSQHLWLINNPDVKIKLIFSYFNRKVEQRYYFKSKGFICLLLEIQQFYLNSFDNIQIIILNNKKLLNLTEFETMQIINVVINDIVNFLKILLSNLIQFIFTRVSQFQIDLGSSLLISQSSKEFQTVLSIDKQIIEFYNSQPNAISLLRSLLLINGQDFQKYYAQDNDFIFEDFNDYYSQQVLEITGQDLLLMNFQEYVLLGPGLVQIFIKINHLAYVITSQLKSMIMNLRQQQLKEVSIKMEQVFKSIQNDLNLFDSQIILSLEYIKYLKTINQYSQVKFLGKLDLREIILHKQLDTDNNVSSLIPLQEEQLNYNNLQFTSQLIEQELSFLLEDLQVDVISQFLTAIDYYFLEFHQFTLDFVEKLHQNNNTATTEKFFNENDIQMSSSLKIFNQNKNLINVQGGSWTRVQNISQYADLFGFNLYTQETERFQIYQQNIVDFNIILSKSLLNIIQSQLQLKENLDLDIQLKFLGKISSPISQKNNNLIDLQFQKSFISIVNKLGIYLKNSEQYVINIIQKKEQEFQYILKSTLKSPFTVTNLPSIVLYLSHIYRNIVGINRSVESVQNMMKKFPSNEDFDIILLRSLDLTNNTSILLQSFFKLWQQSRITSFFKKQLQDPLLKNNIQYNSKNLLVEDNISFALYDRFNYCFSQVLQHLYTQAQDSIHILLLFKEMNYQINYPEALFKTSFELTCLSRLQFFKPQKEYHKFILIAQESQQSVPVLQKILSYRSQIINLLGIQQIFADMFIYQVIDLEIQLIDLSFLVTWSSVRSQNSINKLLELYTELFQIIKFTIQKFKQMYNPFLQDVYQDFTDIIMERIQKLIIGENKLSFVQIQVLFLDMVKQHFQNIHISYTNLFQITQFIKTQIKSISSTSLLFFILLINSNRQMYLLQKLYSSMTLVDLIQSHQNISLQLAHPFYDYLNSQIEIQFIEMIQKEVIKSYCRFITQFFIFILEQDYFEFNINVENDQISIYPSINKIQCQFLKLIQDSYKIVFNSTLFNLSLDDHQNFIELKLYILFYKIENIIQKKIDNSQNIIQHININIKNRNQVLEEPTIHQIFIQEKEMTEFIKISQLEQEICAKVSTIQQLQTKQLDLELQFSKMKWINTKHISLSFRLQTYQNQLQQSNLVRINISQLLQNLEIFLQTFYFCNYNLSKYEQVNSYIQSLIYGTDQLEILYQRSQHIDNVIKSNITLIGKRQYVFFDSQFEYFVQKFYKTDEQFIYNLQQVLDSVRLKCETQRQSLQNLSKNLTQYLLRSCDDIVASFQITYNQYYTNGPTQYYTSNFTKESLGVLVQLLLSTDKKKFIKRKEQTSVYYEQILSSQNFQIISLHDITKYLLGFKHNDIFIVDSQTNIFILSEEPSHISSAKIQYLNNNQISLQMLNQELASNIDIVIQQVFENVFDISLNEQYILFSGYIFPNKLDYFNDCTQKSIDLNKSFQYIFSSQQLKINQLQILIKIQTIYAVQGQLPIEQIIRLVKYIDQLDQLFRVILQTNTIIQQFYRIKAQILFSPLHSQSSQLWYPGKSNANTVLQFFIQQLTEQISILHQLIVSFDLIYSKQFFVFAKLIYFIYYSFKEVILKSFSIVNDYKYDFLKQAFIEEKIQRVETIGDIIELYFRPENFMITIQHISEFSLSYNQNEKFSALKQNVLQLHVDVNKVLQNHLSTNSVILIQLSSRIKEYQQQIQLNVNDLQVKQIVQFRQLEEFYDVISFELKILEVIISSYYSFKQVFELLSNIDQFSFDLIAYQQINNFVQNLGYTFRNNIYTQNVQSIFDFYDQSKKEKIYHIQNIHLAKFQYQDDITQDQYQIPLFQLKTQQNEIIPTINPIAHGFYDNYIYCNDNFNLIQQKDGTTKGLQPQFLGFFAQRQGTFSQELGQPSILVNLQKTQQGSYDLLINDIQGLINVIYLFKNAWSQFIDRFLSQSNFKMLSKKQFPLILSDIQGVSVLFQQTIQQYTKLYKSYCSYNNELLKIQIDNFHTLFLSKQQQFPQISEEQYNKYIEIQQYFFDKQLIGLQNINLFDNISFQQLSILLGLEIQSIILCNQHIIGILLSSNYILLFKNKILFYLNNHQLSLAFVFNFCRQEIINTLQILRIQISIKLGLIRPYNFAFIINQRLNLDISQVYFESMKVLTNVANQVSKNIVSIIKDSTPLLFMGDIQFIFFDFKETNSPFYQFFQRESIINFKYLNIAPDTIYFQLITCLITLLVSACYISEYQIVQQYYYKQIDDIMLQLSNNAQLEGNTERLYFLQILQQQLLQSNEGVLKEYVFKILNDQQIYISTLEQQPLFSEILKKQINKAIDEQVNDESFTEVQVLKVIKQQLFYQDVDCIELLKRFETLLKRIFIIHQIAYSLTLNLKDTIFISGYFEKIPSISFSQYHKLFVVKEQQNIGNTIQSQSKQLQFSMRNSIPINSQVFFDSPFYKFRPFIFEDQYEIFYQLNSFKMHINLVGKQLTGLVKPQQYKFSNYSAKDFYECLLELSSIFTHNVPLVLGSINNHTLYLFGSITGLYILILDNLDDLNIISQKFLILINDQPDLPALINTFYINQQNGIYSTKNKDIIEQTYSQNIVVSQIIIQSKSLQSFRQSCQFASQERIDFNALLFKMDFRDYSSKIIAKFIMQNQHQIASKNYKLIFSTIKNLMNNYHQQDIEQLLINLQQIQFIYKNVCKKFESIITQDNFIQYFEQLFTFSYLLATSQYNLLNSLLSKENYFFLNNMIENFNKYITSIFGHVNDIVFKQALVMLQTEIEFASCVKISLKNKNLLEQIVYTILKIINQQYYKLIQQGDLYLIITESKQITVSFNKVGLIFNLNNLSSLEQYQFSIKFQQYVILEKQYLEIHGEDFRDQLLLIYYLRKYQNVTDEKKLIFYSQFIQKMVINNKTQTCLVSSLEKQQDYKFQIDLLNKKIEPIISFGSNIAEFFSVQQTYINTPQLMILRQYVLSIIIGWIISGYYNKNVFSITIQDYNLTLEQILEQICFDQQYFSHINIPKQKYLVYKIFDEDMVDLNSFDNILLNEYYGVIIVLITENTDLISQLQSKILLSFNNYLLFTLSFAENSTKIQTTNKRLYITNPYNQDLLKIAQFHLVRILQSFNNISLIFVSYDDTIQYTAQFIRRLFGLYSNTQIIIKYIIILSQYLDRQKVKTKQVLVEALQISYVILKLQYQFSNDFELLCSVEPEFIKLIAIFFELLPSDIPLQSYDLDKQEMTTTFGYNFNLLIHNFQKIIWVDKQLNNRFLLQYNEKAREILFIQHCDGQFILNDQVMFIVKQIIYYYQNHTLTYSVKPLKLQTLDRIILSFCSQQLQMQNNHKILMQVIDSQNQDLQYYTQQINIMIQNLQYKLKQIKKDNTLQIYCFVVFQNHQTSSHFNTLLNAFCSQSTFNLFSQKLKNRLKAILQIQNLDMQVLINKFFLPIIQLDSNSFIKKHYYEQMDTQPIYQLVNKCIPTKYINMVQQQITEDILDLSTQYNSQDVLYWYNRKIVNYVQNINLFLLVTKDNKQLSNYEIQKLQHESTIRQLEQDLLTLGNQYHLDLQFLQDIKQQIFNGQESIQSKQAIYYELKDNFMIINNEVSQQENILNQLQLKLSQLQRQVISIVKTFLQPPELVKRMLDCLSILLNININIIESQVCELHINFQDKQDLTFNKMLIVQSTYHQDNIQLDVQKIEELLPYNFKLQEYCFQHGYQIIYTKTSFISERLRLSYSNVQQSDIIFKNNIITSTIIQNEGYKTLSLVYFTPVDSFNTNQTSYRSTVFDDRILQLNPAQITPESIELLQPYLSSPDFNSLTMTQTSEQLFDISNWISVILQIKKHYDIYFPLKYKLIKEKQYLQDLSTELDKVNVILCEDQIILDLKKNSISKNLKDQTNILTKSEFINNQLHTQVNKIQQILEYQHNKQSLLQQYVNEIKFIYSDCLQIKQQVPRNIKCGINIFTDNIFNLSEIDQYLFTINYNIISPKCYFFSSITPWIASFMTTKQAIDFVEQLQSQNNIYVIDADNHFQVVIKGLITQLDLVNSQLKQLNYFSKIQPFYEIQSFEIEIFDSLESLFIHGQSFRDSFLFVYINIKELDTFSANLQIFNLYKANNKIILIGQQQINNFEELSYFKFQLHQPLKYIIMSSININNSLMLKLQQSYVSMYCSLIDYLLCCTENNFEYLDSAKENFESEKQIWIVKYNSCKESTQSYAVFSEICQYLIQLSHHRINNYTESDILYLANIYSHQLITSDKFQEDLNLHEQIQFLIIQDILRYIDKEDYIMAYFKLLKQDQIKNLYKIFTINYFHHLVTFKSNMYKAQVNNINFINCQVKTQFLSILSYFNMQNEKLFKVVELYMIQDPFYLYCLELCFFYQTLDQKLVNHINNGVQLGFLPEMAYTQSVEQASSMSFEFNYPDQFKELIQLYLNTNFEQVKQYVNLCFYYMFGFFNHYRELIQMLPTVDYHIPPKQYEFKAPNQLTIALSDQIEPNINFQLQNQQFNFNQIQQLLIKQEPKILHLDTLQMLNYSSNLANSQIQTNSLNFQFIEEKKLQAQYPYKCENIFQVGNNPHKLLQTILHLDNQILNNLMQLSQLYSDQSIRIVIDSQIVPFVPSVVLALCLIIYQSNQSPFIINSYLRQLYISTVQLSSTEFTQMDFLDLVKPAKVDIDGIQCGRIILGLVNKEHDLKIAMLKAICSEIDQIQVPIKIDSYQLDTIQSYQKQWEDFLNELDQCIEISNAQSPRWQSKSQ